jgi:sialidase-1
MRRRSLGAVLLAAALFLGSIQEVFGRDAAAPMFATGILADPTVRYTSPLYVCLARLRNNDLLAVFAGFGANADQAAIWSCYSSDHGKTWSKPVVAVDTPDTMDADPNIVVCRDRVLAVATTRKANELKWTKFPFSVSRDNGRSWTPGGTIDHFHKYSSGKLQAATRLRNGRLLMPFCWDRILERTGGVITGGEAQMISNAAVLYSDDDGHTWNRGGDLDIRGVPGGKGINGLDEICVAELTDGSVYALCRTGVDRLYEARSTDHGMTWSKPRPSPLVASNAPASMVALDDPKGAVVVVWDETAKGDRKPLTAAYSTDNCRSWSKSKVVFDGYAPYPSVAQAADGTIVAAWFQKASGGTAIGFARFNWAWLSGKTK